MNSGDKGLMRVEMRNSSALPKSSWNHLYFRYPGLDTQWFPISCKPTPLPPMRTVYNAERYDRCRDLWLSNGEVEWPSEALFGKGSDECVGFSDAIGVNCPNGFEFLLDRKFHDGLDATRWRYMMWDVNPF